jgi:hypothetical protein
VSQADHLGKLPLHLACEAGKFWDKGVRAIYDAFPGAIRQPEENARRWLPLTMAAACPNAGADLIDILAELYPEAASEVDSRGRYALHWACASGKSWEGGLKSIFDANPEAIMAEDESGYLPFHVAAFTGCHSSTPNEEETRRSSRSDVNDVSEAPPDEVDAPQIEILFQLLRAEPCILSARY